ncbi:phytanoyl-CoA dioxygenase family protein [Chloroflexi bacterium TSY]|nr:phytanoyl-CoA dioxygenase family protein [Chloroflexi bacterium TSY]
MNQWTPTLDQTTQWHEQGYFTLRNVVPRDVALQLLGVIKNTILTSEPDSTADADPMDPMGDTPAARAARFRKLSRFCSRSPLIWLHVHGGEPMLRVAQHFLGDDIMIKFDSCFLKPARTGSATPWHQDNGLWRDGETEPFNFWMALDPATKANGCLQMIPGSHKEDIQPHVLYEDSIHGEIPREIVADMQERHGIHHVELEPGDVVVWHSSTMHYSPPNTSDQGRIACAGVYTTPQITTTRHFAGDYYWVMKEGGVCNAFPPEVYPLEQTEPPPPFPKAEELAMIPS